MPAAVKPPKLCVFDLDGTLADSLRDIAQALNECLELLGLPGRPLATYRYCVGEGVPRLCQRVLDGAHPHLLERLIELARPRYRTRVVVHTRPYAGVCELVEELRARGIRLAVLSNKPHAMTVRVVRAFWHRGQFDYIQGYVEESYRKPDPHYLLRICEALGVEPEETCLIGDTPTDIETARNGGTASLGVTWGFRTRTDLERAGAVRIVDSPAQVPAALGLHAQP